ncbi:MAG: NAD(P)H-dependent oxidoreductase [Chloroflexota bacterium]
MKILAFAASSSRSSINKQLVTYAASLVEAGIVADAKVEILDLNDYEIPLYSVDREQEGGIPDQAQQFFKKIGEADALLISLAEHNGLYTAAFKSLFDWASRLDARVYQDKPTVLLSTSPGPGGAGNVLSVAKGSARFTGMDIKADLSIPSFYDNFDAENGRVSNSEIQGELEAALTKLN